jgi:hypothetical protein
MIVIAPVSASIWRTVRHIGKHATDVQGGVANLADLDRLFATAKQQHGHFDAKSSTAEG